uniref:DUF4817 domain-containing protein n=1 Tax=Octopus bimaculoides TaxID=37653 RepID=A0A0L8GA10_OCTBM
MAAFKQKLQAVLWLAELKSVEAVRVKWTEQYAEEPPTDQMLLTWKKNFQATENIHSNSDVGTSPLKRPRQDCETTRREDEPEFKFSLQTTLEDIRQKQEDFCTERNWAQYHTPRNVLLALVGEVGELAEILSVGSHFLKIFFIVKAVGSYAMSVPSLFPWRRKLERGGHHGSGQFRLVILQNEWSESIDPAHTLYVIHVT